MSGNTDMAATLATLEERRVDLEYKLADVKGQLEKASAHQIETGEYADADWYRRAKAAQRYAGIEHQQLLRQIADIKRTLRASGANNFEACFINAARELLKPDDFRMVIDAAHQAARA
jgi:predicted O-methyltransferase YrrM